MKEEIGGNEAFLSSNCVMGLYMPTLFTKGYGFSEDTQNIIAVKKLKDTSLGKHELVFTSYQNHNEDGTHILNICGSSSSSNIENRLYLILKKEKGKYMHFARNW